MQCVCGNITVHSHRAFVVNSNHTSLPHAMTNYVTCFTTLYSVRREYNVNGMFILLLSSIKEECWGVILRTSKQEMANSFGSATPATIWLIWTSNPIQVSVQSAMTSTKGEDYGICLPIWKPWNMLQNCWLKNFVMRSFSILLVLLILSCQFLTLDYLGMEIV